MKARNQHNLFRLHILKAWMEEMQKQLSAMTDELEHVEGEMVS